MSRQARTTREWQAADAAHFLHPFTDHAALAARGARIITRADGVHLWDSEGQRIFDAMSGLWCVNVGYGQQSLIDAAAAQLKELPFYNAFFQTAHPPAIELAETLARVAPPGFGQHVFFTGSGSEANDTVVRMVRRYWDLMGEPARHVIISRRNAYHGSTMAGASLGGMDGMHAQGGLPIPGIVHIDQPYWWEHGRHLGEHEFGLLAARWLEDRITEIGAHKVAAFIGEPVQGAGGVIVPPASYWPEVQRICRKHGVLIVSDEVITGFGRTGQWFGCQTMGFEPDLMSFAKGVTSGYVPLGGVLVGSRVARALIDRGGEFNHGYTYSGHPVACAVALANLALVDRLGLVEHVRDEVGPLLAQRFAELAATHPLVGDAQTCGLMGALLLVRHKGAARAEHERFAADVEIGMACRAHCFREGLIMRAVGDRMIVAPPLVVTPAEVDEMMALVRRCLDLTLDQARREGWMR